MGVDGNGTPYPVCESVATWGIWCKNIPFKLMDKVKEPAKRVWNDEHGDDEYISSEGLFLESYTMKVEVGCKKIDDEIDDVRANVGNFIDWLRTAGMINIYSSHTRIGRQYVRLEQIDDKATWKSENGEEYLIFSVTFKVNDPVTNVVLSNE